jgi:alkanesulfonate monooxygenase SsuD/methylene tetrahydromethanopterin reductase-like flavin-dependent oxidoreductase (luciferase family)
MAELAGRLADGWNAPAGLPMFPELVALARRAHTESGRTTPFCVTAFGGYPGTEAGRKRLAGLGVERLILLLPPPFRF